ncbi:GH12688 [Drosophila grimshawi]|uniref:GH12688 n=1 Tax=Drosophila grimshawi TaxID=7222 RepID=B4JKL2_DROGR|nr:GH12688 [Drosophila grimshawi]
MAQQDQQQLSEATALRLFSSIAAGTSLAQPRTQQQQEHELTDGRGIADAGAEPHGVALASQPVSQESVHSANEFGNSCRICRWNRSDMEIINCPCKCKGSVCLKRWIMHRRDNRCEICNAPFNITADRASVMQMVRAFFCDRCCGMILKHLLFSASLMPIANVILQQVLHCMDHLNQGSNELLTVHEVFFASCALLTSSALFFHFFEFVTTRFLLIRNILRHWWMFGSTNDFGLVEVEDDDFDLF